MYSDSVFQFYSLLFFTYIWKQTNSVLHISYFVDVIPYLQKKDDLFSLGKQILMLFVLKQIYKFNKINEPSLILLQRQNLSEMHFIF